jgi:hypothetical protein
MKDYPMGHYIIYIISLIFYLTKTFYSICLMIIKEILFVKKIEEYNDNKQPRHRCTEKKRRQSSIYEYFN